jgi:hypothetical protein
LFVAERRLAIIVDDPDIVGTAICGMLRLTKTGLLALLLAGAFNIAVAQSQRAAPGRGEAAQPREPEQRTPPQPAAPAPDQRGTEASPLIVKVAPTPKSDEERAEEAQQRSERGALERKLLELTNDLAAYALALFAATGVLLFATLGLLIAAFKQSGNMKKSLAVARTSADAAQKSAATAENALTMLERPTMFVVDVQDRILPEAVSSGNALAPEADIFFFNTGRSNAIVQSARHELMLYVTEPADPAFSQFASVRNGTIVIPPNARTPSFLCKYHRGLVKEEIEKIRNKILSVYLLGELVYDDNLGFRTTYTFFAKFHPGLAGDSKFIPLKPSHNRHQKEKISA